MEQQVVKLYQALIKLPTIWPGWDHQNTPIAFFNDEKAILFAHPNAPKEFEEVNQDGLKYYICSPKPKHFTANTSMLLNGVETATMRYYEGEFSGLLGLAVHESFHVYQANHHFPTGNLTIKYPSFDALVNALGEAEGKLLHKAITTHDIKYVKEACDARASRQLLLKQIEEKRLNQLSETEKEEEEKLRQLSLKEAKEKQITVSKTLLEYEDYYEMHEGLAVYTEMKALKSNTKRFKNQLDELLTINEKGKGANRQRFYSSGMAYGLLLDEYVPGWQEILMSNWESLAQILAKGINHTVDATKREYLDLDFNTLYKVQQKAMEAKITKLQDMINEAFPKKGLYVDAKLKGNVVSGGWNPLTVQSLPDGSRLHTTFMLYNYDNEASIYIEKGVIEKTMCQHFVFECQNANILVDDKAIILGEHIGKLRITGDNWKLTVPKAHIYYDGQKLMIQEIIS